MLEFPFQERQLSILVKNKTPQLACWIKILILLWASYLVFLCLFPHLYPGDKNNIKLNHMKLPVFEILTCRSGVFNRST